MSDDDPRFRTHGDPYSDPPRANVCVFCGVLVGDEEAHIAWHKAPVKH